MLQGSNHRRGSNQRGGLIISMRYTSHIHEHRYNVIADTLRQPRHTWCLRPSLGNVLRCNVGRVLGRLGSTVLSGWGDDCVQIRGLGERQAMQIYAMQNNTVHYAQCNRAAACFLPARRWLLMGGPSMMRGRLPARATSMMPGEELHAAVVPDSSGLVWDTKKSSGLALRFPSDF